MARLVLLDRGALDGADPHEEAVRRADAAIEGALYKASEAEKRCADAERLRDVAISGEATVQERADLAEHKLAKAEKRVRQLLVAIWAIRIQAICGQVSKASIAEALAQYLDLPTTNLLEATTGKDHPDRDAERSATVGDVESGEPEIDF